MDDVDEAMEELFAESVSSGDDEESVERIIIEPFVEKMQSTGMIALVPVILQSNS
jgi:hypothetical protein